MNQVDAYRPDGTAAGPSSELSLHTIVDTIAREKRVVLSVAVALMLVAATTALLRARTYTAEAAFVLRTRGGSSNFAGIAAQFGLAVPATEAGRSPQFYADLLTSREILDSVVNSSWGPTAHGRKTLADVFDISESDSARRDEAAVKALASRLKVEVASATGVISVRVAGPDPATATAITTRLVDEVVRFNERQRQAQAQLERRFTEERLAEASADLRVAEDRLTAFEQQNRDVRSPVLALARERLLRDVTLRQQLYTSLSQAFEQSKMEEIRSIPVLTGISSPHASTIPDARGTVGRALVGLLSGLMIGTFVVFARQEWRRIRAARSAAP